MKKTYYTESHKYSFRLYGFEHIPEFLEHYFGGKIVKSFKLDFVKNTITVKWCYNEQY